MEWLASLLDKLKVLFRREQFDHDLEEEMQFHQELQAEAHRQNGLSADEAQRAARRQFGNTTRLREAGWHAWGWAPLERVFQDLRFTVRTLLRSPGFALSVVLLLALAIWMNTTVYSVIHAVMVAPLPFDPSERLVRLYETNLKQGDEAAAVSAANFVDWQTYGHAFEEMAAILPYRCDLHEGGESEQIRGGFVTTGFFTVLRVRPAVGRAFSAEEYLATESGTRAGAAVISHGLWQRRFGGRPEAIGTMLPISDLTALSVVRIVGVMPADFNPADASLGASDIWLPIDFTGSIPSASHMFNVIARLRPEYSLRQAQAEMDVIARQLQAKRPRANADWGVRVADLREAVLGGYHTSLLVLAGAVALVLLIACANVANLMLARGAARHREMATRAAIGADRLRLVMQLATESMFLSVAAGMLGFALSHLSVEAVIAFAPLDLPRISETGVNLAVFWFCLLVALATGLVCGVVPGLRLSRFDLSAALKEGGTVSSGRGRGLLSRSLVVLEVALSLILLVGTALLARSFAAIQTFNPGLRADRLLMVGLEFGRGTQPSRSSASARLFYRELLSRLERVPGVTAAAAGARPGSAGYYSSYLREGSSEETKCRTDMPSGHYFQALGTPLLRGRSFTDSEHAGMPPVVIVNRTAARSAWPAEEAVGKRLLMRPRGKPELFTVVGVVEDVPNDGYQNEPQPQVYFPFGWRGSSPWGTLVIRTSGEAAAVAPTVKALIQSQDNRATIIWAATLEERLAAVTAGLRFNTLLMTVFAALAFLLAASGVYSLMSYTATLRAREMSIRVALGADRGDIVLLVVRTGAVLVGMGVALGLAGALGSTRLASSLLYQVKPRDPAAFIAATVLLVLAALAACYVPARRAASLDVVETLRQE